MPAFFAPDFPIATVATGTPPGIWTVERSESRPFKERVSIGMPMTGKTVWAAITPARCAEPPAAAIMTFIPLARASLACFITSAGVLWADSTFASYLTPNFLRIPVASFTMGRSESLPIMTETRVFFIVTSYFFVLRLGLRCPFRLSVTSFGFFTLPSPLPIRASLP